MLKLDGDALRHVFPTLGQKLLNCVSLFQPVNLSLAPIAVISEPASYKMQFQPPDGSSSHAQIAQQAV